jgi:hypothetical protein
MKKFIFAIYTAALIAMIPAIFIGYLNHDDAQKATQPVVNQVNVSSSVNNAETGFKPGSVIILKGI